MTEPNYPSLNHTHRRADLTVHVFGLAMILVAGGILISKAMVELQTPLIFAIIIYIACALVSNIASMFYHFSPFHERRTLLRRIDHAAIYPTISGTFTPFFLQAGTTWTMTLFWLCWAVTILAIWRKIAGEAVKTRWSTASYLGLGAIGMSALPDLTNVPMSALWCIIAGAVCYVIGTMFYARKTMPFRYSIWHVWVNFGGICMFAGIWIALFY